MSTYNLNNIESEIINDLRYNITDPNGRGSASTDLFDGDNTTKTFTLSSTATCVYVTISSVEQKYGVDYTLNTAATQITFTNAPASGTDNISVKLMSGETWIYPDFNKNNFSLSDFPRIAVSAISSSSELNGISGDTIKSTFLISITIAGKSTQQVNSLLNLVRDRINTRRKSFGSFTMIYPSAESAISNSGLHDRIKQRSIDFFVPYKEEVY